MAMLQVVVEGKTLEELKANLEEAVEALGGEKKGKLIRPSKVKEETFELEEPEQLELEDEVNSDDPVEKPLTRSEVVTALKAYNKKHGPTKTKAVLKKVKATSLHDLDPKYYSDLMEIIA